MHIIYAKSARKIIESLDKNTKQRIKKGIEGLTEIPPIGDIKPMHGVYHSIYRLRIGKYRVLYGYTIVEEKQVLVIKDIGSRGDIYK